MNDKKILYHITTYPEWNAAKLTSEYLPQGFAEDGFIHCSYRHQILTVAHRFYKGQNGLVILVIDSSKINSSHKLLSDRSTEPTVTDILVEENLEGGTELYPHLYCSLPINSVVEAVAFPCNLDGSFVLPKQLKT